MTNPFAKASELEKKRLRLFLYGKPGTLKTRQALQFPKACVVDMEGSSDWYRGEFDFHVKKTVDANEIMGLVDWLGKNKHDFQTLVIDPITMYWEALQTKYCKVYLQKSKKSYGNMGDFYVLQPNDWLPVKGELKEFIRKILALDMHLICIARQKNLYEEGAQMMKKIGDTFDGEKGLDYYFDTVVRMYKDKENGRVVAENEKDRTHSLPEGTFEPKFIVWQKILEKCNNQPSKPIESKPENGNGKHPPNYIPSPREEGWELFPIPDSYLYKELRGKGISWETLARDNGTFCMDTKLNHMVKARYLLHKMLGYKEKPEVVALAKAILELYPSKEDECKIPQFTEPVPVVEPEANRANIE